MKCPKPPPTCLNNCKVGGVPGKVIEAHKKECPLEMIQCEYHNYMGCEVNVTRKEKIKDYL